MNEWMGWLAACGGFSMVMVGVFEGRRGRRKTQPKMPAQINMETVYRYVTACAARRWRPVFTLDQFREMYQAVMADPSIPHTDSLPPLYDRVTLYGVEIAVSDSPRPPMPEALLDRDATIEEPERIRRDLVAFSVAQKAREETRHATDYARALGGGQQEWDGYEVGEAAVARLAAVRALADSSYEAHDLPPRSM